MNRIDQRLRALEISLPRPPMPSANYESFVRSDGMVFLSGVAPCLADRRMIGQVSHDKDILHGQRAARSCALNLIANLKLSCDGDLDRVQRILRVRGFVNATSTFTQLPQVIDGASDLLIEVFGSTIGRHARTAIGCATLPSGVTVELDALVTIGG